MKKIYNVNFFFSFFFNSKQLAFAQKKSMTKSDPVLNKVYNNSNYKGFYNIFLLKNNSFFKYLFNLDSESNSTDDMNTVYSSVRSDNLKDIWKIIDDHENNSLLNSADNDPIASLIKVSGIKANNQKKATPPAISKSPRQKSALPSARGDTKLVKPKIRNYNDKF